MDQSAVNVAGAFRECLDTGDAGRLTAIWAYVYPGLPQPPDKAAAEVVLHRARTAAESVRLAARLYSHAWLTERAHPSDLPQDLRPVGERIKPVIVRAVCIGVRTTSSFPDRIEQAKAVEAVMAAAAGEMTVAGIYDKTTVTEYMWRKRAEFLAGTLRHEI